MLGEFSSFHQCGLCSAEATEEVCHPVFLDNSCFERKNPATIFFSFHLRLLLVTKLKMPENKNKNSIAKLWRPEGLPSGAPYLMKLVDYFSHGKNGYTRRRRPTRRKVKEI